MDPWTFHSSLRAPAGVTFRLCVAAAAVVAAAGAWRARCQASQAKPYPFHGAVTDTIENRESSSERPRLTSTSSTPPSPDPSTPTRDAISIRFERRVAPSRPPSTSFQLLPMAGQLDATVAAGNCQCDRHKQGPPCSCVRPLLILWGSFTSMALLRGGADGDSATRNLRVARPPCARRLLD